MKSNGIKKKEKKNYHRRQRNNGTLKNKIKNFCFSIRCCDYMRRNKKKKKKRFSLLIYF